MRRKWLVLVLVASLLFLVGLIRVASHALTRGGAYPEYSSFRADPLGAKALHDTLARLPGFEVGRHLRPLRLLKASESTLLWLGEHPWAPPTWRKEEFDSFDAVLRRGNRVVIGLAPALALKVDPKARRGPLEERWGLRLRFDVLKAPLKPSERRRTPRETHAWLELLDPAAWNCFQQNEAGHCLSAERALSGGTLVLTTALFPLSNEGLRIARDTSYVARLLGPHQKVVFDEEHLGLEDSSSIGLLLRQFNQQGAIAALLTLFALFVWRSTSGLLPPREPAPDANVDQRPHRSLVLLLRRGVRPAQLSAACLAEWQRSLALLPFKHRARAARITTALQSGESNAASAWQQARQKLQGTP